ncbi:NAD(+) diphosphatase [Phocoenobacter skyensis]|uniref:NAD-capped RNA hydrolase NudC n=1 Tax=Phocoenobacter skyensis TaxID=97481 RepID=A0A1H7V0L2_9PAST|nr:NAD(+) diphosphatase [Pasteurella skyensis]MDP8078507.1 NAD(+) diphosphatase [Pasteurella skyensis]MDP8084401.1 NAD(+) diphosphatase [Pasteurella skyensis]MDP8184732.1 NAD(+) diphosphatase [Pasteurella skyensis]QLB23206.1 NADH pyrophosphatase [Pasteurella skyensis]SEM02458.1 NAD+ diphosphatase [Pasteurella skyensis]
MKLLPQNQQCYWLQVYQSQLYLPNNEIPFGTTQSCGLNGKQGIEIAQYNGFSVWLIPTQENEVNDDFVTLRSQLFQPEQHFYLLNKAVSLNHFFAKNRFCGSCGEPFYKASDEMALHCDACGSRVYPKISPSIIVAIRRNNQILLANHFRHKGTIYTNLAGFVETGETLEQTVEREVFEETGIKIKNIRYFGSQPWAFPDSLMLGFLADYESGEITLQEEEIFDARWFDYNKPLPQLPPKGTIALKLIEATLALCEKNQT